MSALSLRVKSTPSFVCALVAACTALGINVLLPAPASAQVVYNNGIYASISNGIHNGISARDITEFAQADDFLVSSSLTFNAIRFYAVEFPSGFVTMTNFSGTLSWAIYQDSGGTVPNSTPSSVLVASGSTSTVAQENTFDGLIASSIFQLDFTIPTQTLGAGRYWLRLKEGSPSSASDGSSINWVMTNSASTGNGYRADEDEVNPTTWTAEGTDTTNDFAFQLLNTGGAAAAAPEPGTCGLLALGIITGGVIALRKRIYP